MKEMYRKILYIFILMQPFIDLATSLMTRFDIFFISLGTIVKGIFVLLMLIYLFFFNRSKYKRISIIYIILLIIFYCGYLFTKPDVFMSFSAIFNEITSIFKYSYFPIFFITTINFIDQYDIDRSKIIDLFTIDLFIYSILIIIPSITNTGFNSYQNNEGYGIVGWFYSANEISAIMTIIYPLLFINLDKKFNVKDYVMIVSTIVAIIMIGTKTPFYGMLIITFILAIYYLFNVNKKTKQFIFIVLILLFTIFFKTYIPANINYEKRVECQNDYYNEKTTNEKDNSKLECQVAEGQKVALLSGRDVLLKQSFKMYRDSKIVDKFFGIGFTNRNSINNGEFSKLVEMDFFDILFRFGIIGFVLYMLPVFVIILKVAISFIKNLPNLNVEKIIYSYGSAIGIGIGFLVGHVFGSPAVGFYLAPITAFTLGIFDKKM